MDSLADILENPSSTVVEEKVRLKNRSEVQVLCAMENLAMSIGETTISIRKVKLNHLIILANLTLFKQLNIFPFGIFIWLLLE